MDHRFSEHEIRDVFERAAAEQERAARNASTDGLTMDELAEVGEASGIRRDFVEAAARAVRLGAPESRRETRAGVTTGVGHTAFLAEPPSDDLWGRLVADARQTFGARGTVDTAGDLREWRNGNLVLTLEPAADGSRLDVRTSRADALTLFWLGAVLAFAGFFVAGAGGDWTSALLIVVGVTLAAVVGLRQQSWGATRDAQMRGLVERASSSGFRPAGPAVAAPEPEAAPEPRLDLDGLDLDALGDELGDARTGEARRARS